ncbi:hypothetical protein MRB53_026771 [Persea americana]|uniref:Uncharacterized protein n=1 Tax=Persea americana TaxID=3435 RepID=A0ACC2LJ03_PERAE|nr:hypothetical protein MRB53_026771 [Persea americana]
MPCPIASDAGTANVASARDTVVTAMPKVAAILGVAAEPYTKEPERVAVAAEEINMKLRPHLSKEYMETDKLAEEPVCPRVGRHPLLHNEYRLSVVYFQFCSKFVD